MAVLRELLKNLLFDPHVANRWIPDVAFSECVITKFPQIHEDAYTLNVNKCIGTLLDDSNLITISSDTLMVVVNTRWLEQKKKVKFYYVTRNISVTPKGLPAAGWLTAYHFNCISRISSKNQKIYEDVIKRVSHNSPLQSLSTPPPRRSRTDKKNTSTILDSHEKSVQHAGKFWESTEMKLLFPSPQYPSYDSADLTLTHYIDLLGKCLCQPKHIPFIIDADTDETHLA